MHQFKRTFAFQADPPGPHTNSPATAKALAAILTVAALALGIVGAVMQPVALVGPAILTLPILGYLLRGFRNDWIEHHTGPIHIDFPDHDAPPFTLAPGDPLRCRVTLEPPTPVALERVELRLAGFRLESIGRSHQEQYEPLFSVDDHREWTPRKRLAAGETHTFELTLETPPEIHNYDTMSDDIGQYAFALVKPVDRSPYRIQREVLGAP